MASGIFVAAQDFVGEGCAAVLDRVAGLDLERIVLAMAYHRARDVTPRAPGRVTVRHDGVYFTPPADLFGPASLPVPVVADDLAVADSLVPAAAARGFVVEGWTVFCHNETIGTTLPEVTQRNCFGGYGSPADLCPANPFVRRYAVDLATAVAGLGVASVLAESLHYGFFDHGYHHERSAVRLGAIERYLLGLCFCAHCVAAAADRGIDAERARAAAAAHVDGVLAGGSPSREELSPAALGAITPELADLVLARLDVVTSLVAETATAVSAAGCTLGFIDVSGALLGYADGDPQGPPAADVAWRLGVDPGAVAAHVAEYVVLAYARDPGRVAEDTAAYRRRLGADRQLRVVLRPGAPDTDGVEHLRARAQAALDAGASGLDFYHYGLLTDRDLDRIAAVTRGSLSGGSGAP